MVLFQSRLIFLRCSNDRRISSYQQPDFFTPK